ncbi:ATP-binding protein [Anaerobacillus sp. CMMVII]|uniref:ATP-binding protein n=1 Tax=Anaerobacillus sp. CMMVII TaxID=2755588 RepID=UPI0021B77200|nr:ATP-binding protein [Anaerobacillus sp. CMMVII]MCT8137599.1 ATP-binding protein [Anaerobacillus sp. CMMVII]
MSQLQLEETLKTDLVMPKFKTFQEQVSTAFEVVDDVVLKNYISKLEQMNIVPLDQHLVEKNLAKSVRMFKINEIVYAKDEDATYKLSSVLNAGAVTESSVFILVDSDGTKVDFYMGIRSLNENKSTKTSYDTLKNAMNGHFPGIKTENVLKDEIEEVLNGIGSNAVSIVTGVANYKDSGLQNNQSFIQGLEKLALTMQGEVFTGVILANPTNTNQLIEVRKQYENIYSMLSPLATTQVSYGVNESTNKTKTYTEGSTEGTTHTENESSTDTVGSSETANTSTNHSKNTGKSSAGKTAAGALTFAGALVGSVVPGVGTMIGGAIGGAIGGLAGTAIASFTHETVSTTTGTSTTNNTSMATTTGKSEAVSHTTSESQSDAFGTTSGNTESIQLTQHNKTIQSYLSKIDQQLERLQEFESLGMWECAAYFMSDTPYAADIAAATYKSLMQGENTGVEISHISSWSGNRHETQEIQNYVKNFIHPVFTYSNNGIEWPIMPTSLVSGKELAIHMSLPRKSINGFPVIEHAEFAQEVVTYRETEGRNINLGSIYNMGQPTNSRVKIDLQSLSMHTLITGSTGSGKSNTVYEILLQLKNQGINFLVIEPAKGEYKHVFGHGLDVTVLGTNPKKSTLLKINPFSFPEDIHVLEHIDRLVEIFNVCWPMYAAMPAILKEAIIHAYEQCGWDLENSVNEHEDCIPTFKDILNSLEEVIQKSAYDAETKGNYTGSLVTRVKSLTNGINGQIFCSKELDNQLLFDQNVIVDLSRVGSSETKSLIMGILVMRLSEYRMANANGMNEPLKHVTVLEEAHNILKKTSTEQQGESSNVLGKSVEMLSNAIAEMRTFGEGFIIADQSPSMLDMSAVRNTNTKIIMRLPDETDRRLIGKSAGMKDEQLDEIIKLPQGVSVVFQNDWVAPVLCKINYFNQGSRIYEEVNLEQTISTHEKKKSVIKFLLQKRVRDAVVEEQEKLSHIAEGMTLSSKMKHTIQKAVHDESYQSKLFEKDMFGELSKVVYELLDGKTNVSKFVRESHNIKDLNRYLYEFIEKQIPGLSHEYKMATIQCLLHTDGNLNKREIYDSWIEAVRGGGIK